MNEDKVRSFTVNEDKVHSFTVNEDKTRKLVNLKISDKVCVSDFGENLKMTNTS